MGNAKGQGRKTTPTKIKLLKGNPGKRKLNKDEPDPEVRLPNPPAHLDKVARAEWQRTGTLLVEMGLMTDLDVAALAAYCVAYSHWVDAEEQMRKHGILMKSTRGEPTRSPYWFISTKSMALMKSFMLEFGMSPSSRSGVSGKEEARELTDFEKLYPHRL